MFQVSTSDLASYFKVVNFMSKSSNNLEGVYIGFISSDMKYF